MTGVRDVRTDRITMQIREQGDGADVVLIGGLADDSATWQHQLDVLCERFRLTAVDNRGVGGTHAPGEPHTITEMALDLAALLQMLDRAPVHLVGNSMGGAIAQELTLRHPDLVRSLVLSGSWARSDAAFRAVISSWASAAADVSDRSAFFAGVIAWAVAPTFYACGVEASIVAMAQEHNQRISDFVLQCRAVLDFDSLGRLEAIEVPTLILWGEHDALVGQRHGLTLAASIPHAVSQCLPGVGHSPYLEEPDAFNAAVQTFWESLPTR